MIDRIEAVAAEEGLVYRLHQAQRANTVDAHRLLHLALETGGPTSRAGSRSACWRRTSPSPQRRRPRRAARAPRAAGLDAARVDEVLASDEYAADVQADIEQAHAYGASGVPFFVIDGKYGVSGAQPAEVFGQVLRRAWAEREPSLQMVGGGDDVCGPDGCAW